MGRDQFANFALGRHHDDLVFLSSNHFVRNPVEASSISPALIHGASLFGFIDRRPWQDKARVHRFGVVVADTPVDRTYRIRTWWPFASRAPFTVTLLSSAARTADVSISHRSH
jgi:hypothetical protein